MATILLADDSDDLRGAYAASLRAAGHTVLEAAEGRKALELVRQYRPDLLLLDVWMPNLNGFEVLASLRGEAAATQLKVIMLSVLGDGDSQLEAFGNGASHYLVKGIGLTELLAKVQAVLNESLMIAGTD